MCLNETGKKYVRIEKFYEPFKVQCIARLQEKYPDKTQKDIEAMAKLQTENRSSFSSAVYNLLKLYGPAVLLSEKLYSLRDKFNRCLSKQGILNVSVFQIQWMKVEKSNRREC